METPEAMDEMHAQEIQQYMYRQDGCVETGLYPEVNSRSRLHGKIQVLNDAGLRTQRVSGPIWMYIANRAKQVASRLAGIEEILGVRED